MALKKWASTVSQRLDELSGTRLGIVRHAIESFGEARGAQAAASMAYYAFFSLFPLLLALVAATGFFVADADAEQEVLRFVSQAIPVSRALIERNIEQVLALRGSVGIVALVTLLWSAAGFFTALAYNVNLAFRDAEPRGFLARRLIGLAMIGTLFVLLILSLLSSLAPTLLQRLQIPAIDGLPLDAETAWEVVARVLASAFTLLLFLLLYRWAPNTNVSWQTAFWAALVVAAVWEILKEVFVWYLGTGLVEYELVYGSLGAVVALLFWIYISAWLVIFGAHFAAAIASYVRAKGAA